MKFSELKEFLDECISKNIKVPLGLSAVLEDFNEQIPEDFHKQKWCEYNYRNGEELYPIYVMPLEKLFNND